MISKQAFVENLNSESTNKIFIDVIFILKTLDNDMEVKIQPQLSDQRVSNYVC